MNKQLLSIFLGLALLASSCKKDNVAQNTGEQSDLDELAIPAIFSWQTTRDVNFSIGITDARFQNQIHVVAIYLADPTSGAPAISKGAATLTSPFNAKLSIPAGVNEVYVVKFAPDATTTTEKLAVTTNKVSTALASIKPTEKLSSLNVPTKVMTTVAEPDCDRTLFLGDINISSSSSVYCYYPLLGNPTIDVNASNVTLRLTAPGKTITIESFNHTNLKLYIGEGTTVIFKTNVEIKAGESIINNGTIIAPNMTVTGTLVNSDALTISGTTFTMNGTSSSITNNGTLNAGSASLATNGTITNSGTFTVNDINFNTEATLNNYCAFVVNGNAVINSSKITNNGLIEVKGDTNISSNGTITMGSYNMFQTATLTSMNGLILGRGILPALFKVTGAIGDNVVNNSGIFRGNVQFCGSRDLNVNQNNKKHFELFASQGCSVTIPKSSCNPLGSGASVIVDSDGDGVTDLLDDYPSDKTKAFKNYSANYAEGGSTVAFEDNWPKKGDFDLNDVVMNYKHLVITNKDNIVVRVEGEWNLLATGGEFQNGAGIQFPLTKASATNFVSSNSLTPEAGQDSLVVLLFTNSRLEQATWNTRATEPASAAKKYTFSFDVTNGPTLLTMGASGYNPFIWNNTNGYGRGYETHLQGKKATKLVNSQLFNTIDDKSTVNNKTYSTVNQLPWAIEIPQATFAYPMEMQDISKTYLKFSNWASSGGTTSIDWYSNTGTGYRDVSKIFTGATGQK
jgi:LruC domain-containing protein